MRAFILSIVLAVLSGCSLLPYGPQVEALVDQAREQGTIDRKKSNDDKLALLLDLTCDGSIGAAARMEDLNRRRHLFALCGLGEAEQPGTAAELMEALTLMQALQKAQP